MKKLILYALCFCAAGNISAQQRIGIGNSAPLMPLHVTGTDSAVALLENSQALNTNTGTALYFKTGAGFYPYTGAVKTIGENASAARLAFFTYASGTPNGLKERLSITDAGNLGIGTVTPQTDLHIDPAGAGSVLIGTDKNAGGYTNLEMGISTQSNGYGFVQATKTSGTSYGVLALNQNGGNVGVGTTAPTSTLDVHGGISLPIKLVTTDYFVQSDDYTVIVDMQNVLTHNVNVYLPTTATNKGRIIKLVAINQVSRGAGFTDLGTIPPSPYGQVFIHDASGSQTYYTLTFNDRTDYTSHGGAYFIDYTYINKSGVTLQCIGAAPGWYVIDEKGYTNIYHDEH